VAHSGTAGHPYIPFSNRPEAKHKGSPGLRCLPWPPSGARTPGVVIAGRSSPRRGVVITRRSSRPSSDIGCRLEPLPRLRRPPPPSGGLPHRADRGGRLKPRLAGRWHRPPLIPRLPPCCCLITGPSLRPLLEGDFGCKNLYMGLGSIVGDSLSAGL
jgi:hypothetical protein